MCLEKAVPGSHRHAQGVLIMIEVVVLAPVLEKHVLVIDRTGGGVVHVEPGSINSLARQAGHFVGPPGAGGFQGEIGEGRHARPHQADVFPTLRIQTKDALPATLVVDAITGLTLDAGIEE